MPDEVPNPCPTRRYRPRHRRRMRQLHRRHRTRRELVSAAGFCTFLPCSAGGTEFGTAFSHTPKTYDHNPSPHRPTPRFRRRASVATQAESPSPALSLTRARQAIWRDSRAPRRKTPSTFAGGQFRRRNPAAQGSDQRLSRKDQRVGHSQPMASKKPMLSRSAFMSASCAGSI